MEVSCDGEQNKAKQNKDLTSLKMVANFVCLVPVRLLLSRVVVLSYVPRTSFKKPMKGVPDMDHKWLG